MRLAALPPLVVIICLSSAPRGTHASGLRDLPTAEGASHIVQSTGTRRRRTRRTTPPPKPADAGQPARQAPPVRLEGVGEPAPRPAGKSDDELAAEAFAEALNDALRKPQAGETRVRGLLTRIECVPKGLVFVVRSGERTLRLAAPGFDGLHIVAYTKDAGAQLTCGARRREAPAVVTYRAPADAGAKADGSLVALEFVPADFKLKQ